MKKMQDFNVYKIDISTSGRYISGGVEQYVQTSGEQTLSNGCVSKTEDGFSDTNGDGLWSEGESGYSDNITTCPPCQI